MMTLEEILQKYFNCVKPFQKNGDFTIKGSKSYEELITLLYEIGKLTNSPMEHIVKKLDEITNDNY